MIARPILFASWRDVPADDWRWPNFPPVEIACRGTAELLVDPDALDRLQALRDAIKRPMIVNSGYRSEAHNRAVGGAAASQHRLGRAFDIAMSNHDPAQFEALARRAGFTGFGFYPPIRGGGHNFIHIDTGPARQWGTRWWSAERPARVPTPEPVGHEPGER